MHIFTDANKRKIGFLGPFIGFCKAYSKRLAFGVMCVVVRPKSRMFFVILLSIKADAIIRPIK